VSRSLSFALGLSLLALPARAQTYCAIVQPSDQTSLPAFSGTVKGVFAMPAGGGQYLYMMTQYGVVRGSLADPAHPGPFVLAQIGHKSTQGVDNGGKVEMVCDCWQGGNTIDAAEAPDGSARMVSDWNGKGGGLDAEVATADASNKMAFGQQINSQTVLNGSRVAVLYLPSGKYVGYFPFTSSPNQGGVALVDVTSPNGSPSIGGALQPFATLNWGAGKWVLLKSALSAGKYLLVGAMRAEGKIRIAEVDPTSGVPTEKASISSAATVLSLSVATVEGRTFIFSGEANLQVYEYANGALQAAGTIPGDYDEVVVRGGAFPLIFGHNAVNGSTYIDIFDTNWLTRGGAPRQAARIDHSLSGSHPSFLNYLGTQMEAVVSGNTAYLYRLRPGSGLTAQSIIDTTKVDISCISFDPSSPPIASYSATNLSAFARTDKTNYFGDRWRVQDISATAAAKPLTEIDWDLNVPAPHTTSEFSADPAPWSGAASAALKNLNSPTGIVWPCDPTSSGDPKLGTGCYASLGSPSGGGFYLGLHTENGNLPLDAPSSTTVTPGTGVAVAVPAVVVTGLNAGALNVLSGGSADASSSQGNLAEATFVWAFRGATGALPAPTCQPVASNCAKVLVPSAAISFTLDVTYLGGYRAPQVAGAVNVVDLVPDFSPTSASVVKGGGVVLTNKMQKGSAATLQTVEASWTGAVGSFTVFAGPCPGGPNCSFLNVNGSATLTVPGTTGSYTLYLKYNFTGSQGPQSLKVFHGPFVVVSDNLRVTLSGPTSAARNATVTFTATITGAAGTPTITWCWDACSVFPTFTSGQAVQTHAFSNTGQNTVVVKVVDSGVTVTDSTSINITGSGPPPPGGFIASLSGPTTGSANQAVTFNASASGGTSPITYAWRWGDNALAGYEAGPASNTYTYSAPGTYTVSVRATDAANKTATATKSITISGQVGKPAPSGLFDVAGAKINPFNGQLEAEAFQPITFTAKEANASVYAWDFGDGTTASTKSLVKSFAAAGAFTVKLTVTGDDANTSGTASSTRKFAIGAPQFSAVVVPDAAAIVTADGAWKTDVTVTNSGPSPLTISPIYRSYESLVPVPPSTGIDVTGLGFDSVTKYTIAPGGSWSQADIVGFLGGAGKGNLFFKTEGGPPPEVAARVYFAPSDPELGAYGNAIAAFQVGAFGQVGVQQARAVSEQTILGVRSDDKFRFKVKLYNSSGEANLFRLQAFDETGAAVTIKDLGGNPVSSFDIGVGAYQAAELSDEGLGLNDPAHRYVLKAEPLTSGAMLLASASIIDRTTNDQVRLADDATRPSEEGGAVRVFVPAVSRYDTAISHWRTSVSILNSASIQRGVLVEYIYGPALVAQRIYTMEAGKLLSFDDIAEIFPLVPEIAAQAGTAGLLKISYAADAETPTQALLVSARAYDDRSATTGGTAGTALSSYSSGDAIGFGDVPIVIPGAETNDRFRTNAGVFALDDEVTVVKVTAVDKDGLVVGVMDGIALNNPGSSGPWVQFPISLIQNLPVEPVSLRVEVAFGGRVGAYAINIDQKSSDTTFIKGTR
jgi:PKD repeat protein